MLFQITNTCNMGCPHCLDKATCEPMHMGMDVFNKAIMFAKQSGARVVLVSGGEASLHPHFAEIMVRCCSAFEIVSLVTNGEWLGDSAKENAILFMLRQFPSLTIQITSVEEFYKRHNETLALAKTFALRLKKWGLKGRMVVCTEPLQLKALGRAAESKELTERALKAEGTMSCFASALVSAQLPYLKTIENLESRGKFCHPLVDWQGKVHWSESWLCPHFGDVMKDSFAELEEKARKWRPCCGCADAEKLRNNKSEKYMVAKAILGL